MIAKVLCVNHRRSESPGHPGVRFNCFEFSIGNISEHRGKTICILFAIKLRNGSRCLSWNLLPKSLAKVGTPHRPTWWTLYPASLFLLWISLQVATRILKTNFYSEQAGHDLLIHFWNNNCSWEGSAESLNYIRKYASQQSAPIQCTEHIIIIIFKFYYYYLKKNGWRADSTNLATSKQWLSHIWTSKRWFPQLAC